MRTVLQHPVDEAHARAGLARARAELETSLAAARTSAAALEPLRTSALACAGYLAALEPVGAELGRALRLGAQAAGATFALAARTYGRLELPLGPGAPVSLPATGPTETAHVRAWREGFLLATVARDRRTLGALAKAPLATVRGAAREPEYLLRYAALMQGLWAEAPDVPQRLVAVLAATAPQALPPAAEEHALNLVAPELEALYRFLIADRAAFADALAWALERHRVYWTRPGRAPDPAGFLALGPAAVAAVATEAGWPIDVASAYVPPAVVAGTLPTR
ncbi:MAG TPA: immunity 49 family protein [Polyangia bacterium]